MSNDPNKDYPHIDYARLGIAVGVVLFVLVVAVMAF